VDDPLIISQELFRSLAARLRENLQSESKALGWTNAIFDLRYSSREGAGWASILQVTVAGAPVELGLSDNTVNHLIRQIRTMRIG
jgi:hypothetical protein